MLAGNHILPLVTMAGRVVGWGGGRLGDEEGAAPWVPGEGWLKDSAQQQEAAGENVCLALLLHSPSAGTHTPAGLRQPPLSAQGIPGEQPGDGIWKRGGGRC